MLRTLFGLAPKVDLAPIIQRGAVILDVRTAAEFATGHVEDALNIPLDQLQQSLSRVPKGKPVITCCLSGGRSGVAEGLLRDHGFEAYNGGPWTQVDRLFKR